jgi:hypothetical protein
MKDPLCLTDKQRFAMVAARNGDIREDVNTLGWRSYITFFAYDSDITSQVKALRKRQMLKYDRLGVGEHRVVVPTSLGMRALAAGAKESVA